MFVAYTASSVSKTDPSKQFHGDVIINATPTVDPNHIQYSVVAFQFVLDNLQFSGSGAAALCREWSRIASRAARRV